MSQTMIVLDVWHNQSAIKKNCNSNVSDLYFFLFFLQTSLKSSNRYWITSESRNKYAFDSIQLVRLDCKSKCIHLKQFESNGGCFFFLYFFLKLFPIEINRSHPCGNTTILHFLHWLNPSDRLDQKRTRKRLSKQTWTHWFVIIAHYHPSTFDGKWYWCEPESLIEETFRVWIPRLAMELPFPS